MESETMPEIIPIWISRFDTLMPETRGWPRPVPRKGGDVSITIGESLTSRIQPVVEEWKRIASKGRRIEDVKEEVGKGSGDLDGKERDLRIRICEILQDAVRALGVDVERQEGRFESGEWSNSTIRQIDTKAAKDQPAVRASQTPI
jgi:monolysocardiolipin acyltransferase